MYQLSKTNKDISGLKSKYPNYRKYIVHTPNQINYNSYLLDENVKIVVGIGVAGTGKTWMSSSVGIDKLVKKDIDKIIITRPTVSLDETLGYLPGDLQGKMTPWLMPIFDSFKEYITTQRLKEYLVNEDIEICPLSFIRGRTFNNCWIIADEVQNSTVSQMKSLLTRIGNNSKMVLTGDLEQTDLKDIPNGLGDFLKRYELSRLSNNDTKLEEIIKIVIFNENDIMRSEVVKEIINIYKF